MKIDSLKKYVALRQSLTAEKARLEALARISAAQKERWAKICAGKKRAAK
jgi:hypothetical protein